MAQSLTLRSARRACTAAPLPRLPQPIRPIFRVSLPSAWTKGALARAAALAPAAVVLRKSRRSGEGAVTGWVSTGVGAGGDSVPRPGGRGNRLGWRAQGEGRTRV